MFTKSIVILAAAAGFAAAAPAAEYPTTTYAVPSTAALPVSSAVVTHRVALGLGGLRFEPNNVVANVGEIVEFKFLPANHSVAESSFDEPCKPILDAATGVQKSIFSGFNFVTANGLAPDVFQIKVTDTKPTWIYCPQPKGGHCVAGMSMVINQKFDSPKTLAAYQALAAAKGELVIPSVVQGGQQGPNPNPNAGFP